MTYKRFEVVRFPSKVRFKLFTLDHRLVHGRLGQLDADDAARVQHALRLLLGLRA